MTNTYQQPSESVKSLVALGFSELEAAVYTYLVENSPATGYRVAHDVGRPVANTYKAIESLHQKGAVIVDKSGDNRQVRAVAPKELLDQLGSVFHKRHAMAAEALSQLEPVKEDFGVYTLANAEQVFARASQMLARAREIVLADLFPLSLSRLRPDLEAAAARGITVVTRIYETTVLEGVETVPSVRGTELLDQWPGQWLNLIVDGEECLLSFLTRDGQEVHQAVWSGSPFLSLVYHISFAWEITAARVEHALQDDDVSIDRIKEIIGGLKHLGPSEALLTQATMTSIKPRVDLPVADLLLDR